MVARLLTFTEPSLAFWVLDSILSGHPKLETQWDLNIKDFFTPGMTLVQLRYVLSRSIQLYSKGSEKYGQLKDLNLAIQLSSIAYIAAQHEYSCILENRLSKKETNTHYGICYRMLIISLDIVH